MNYQKPSPKSEFKRLATQGVAFDQLEYVTNEENLLSAMMVTAKDRPLEIDWVEQRVKESYFLGDPTLRFIYRAILTCREKFGAFDVTVLREILVKSGRWDTVGGASRVAKIIKIGGVHPRFYATRVREQWQRYQILELAESMRDTALDPASEIETVMSDLLPKFDKLTQLNTVEFVSLGEAMARVSDRVQTTHTAPMCWSGLEPLDDLVGGFCPGEVIVISARTSEGKTALATQIAEYNARQKRQVLFITLEMREWEIANRIAARELDTDVKSVRANLLDMNQRAEMQSVAEWAKEIPLYLHYAPRMKPAQLMKVAQQFKAEHGCSLLVFDYIQIAGSDAVVDQKHKIDELMSTLKEVAGKIGCPVLAISQLNRDTEKQNKPALGNLGGSSSIENDADVVLALNLRAGKGSLCVLKNRNGTQGDIHGLVRQGKRMTFTFDDSGAL